MITPPSVEQTIREMYEIFGADPDVPALEEVEPDEVPEPYYGLLVHEEHMTVTMEAFHECSVELRIIERSRSENLYARKIMLTSERMGQMVQFGIMRFNFDYCSDEVRDEIIEGITPLGRILIQHSLMRRIDVHSFVKVQCSDELTHLFDIDTPSETYGRIATIFCDEKPAVELLEISAPVG